MTKFLAMSLVTALAVFPAAILSAQEDAQESAQEPAATEPAAPAGPQVVFETSKGTIVIELFPDKAPKTVENFLGYVEEGFYEGTIFHRVIPGFMVQGGGFTADMTKKETKPPIQNEADNGLKNDRGTLAMARTGDPHSATAQFFVSSVNNDYLNHTSKTARGWGYTVFARVVEGMDVVDAISAVPTGVKNRMRDVPQEPVVIKKTTVKK